jgi:hypothetical protein
MKNNLFVFVVVNLFCGIATFLGSILGNAFSQASLFTGAIIGGITGVLLSTLLLRKKLIDADRFLSSTLWGWLFSVTNLNSPIIPVISLSFAGLGCVAGNSFQLYNGLNKPFYYSLLGFLAMLPAFYFVIGSLVKYNLNFSQSFTLLDLVGHSSATFHLFNVISPPIRVTIQHGKLFSLSYNSTFQKMNLVITVTGCLLLFVMVLYLLLENL